MKRLESLNQVTPDRHLLDGKVPFGDYLYRMAQWLERVPVKVADLDAIADELESLKASGKPINTAVRSAPIMKTVYPGKSLSKAIMNFLHEESAEGEFPEYRLKFGPEFRHPFVASDEAMMQMQNILALIPSPLPETSKQSNAYEHEPPQAFQGSKPLEVKAN